MDIRDNIPPADRLARSRGWLIERGEVQMSLIRQIDPDPAYTLRQHENWCDDRSGYSGAMKCGKCAARMYRDERGYLVCPMSWRH